MLIDKLAYLRLKLNNKDSSVLNKSIYPWVLDLKSHFEFLD